MLETIVSIFVAAIVVLIYRRYRNVFCLPFFWAAFFVCQYLGLLRLRAQYGGISYAYAATAFGAFYAGLLAADFLILFRSRSQKHKSENHRASHNSAKPASRPDQQSRGTRIGLLFPILPLNVGLFVSLFAATFITLVFFAENGIPIFSSFPALAWVESTSGVANRIVTVFGPGCYATLGLVAWAVHRESGSRAARAMMYLGLGLAILSDALLASKAAAILIFIWFNIILFYMNKKRKLWKSLVPLVIVVVPISFAIVAIRLSSSQGYWQTTSVYLTYYDRLTTEAAQPVDYIFKYMNRFGPMHGHAMYLEVERIEEQLTGRTHTPILSELVYDLMNGQSTNDTGLSAGLMIYGTGYVEWGLAGLLLYSILQGLIYGWVHRYLLRQKSMNVIMLIIWGALLSYIMSTSGTGTILVGLEYVLLDTIPPLAFLLPFCAFFLLPVARKSAASVSGKFSRAPQSSAGISPRWEHN